MGKIASFIILILLGVATPHQRLLSAANDNKKNISGRVIDSGTRQAIANAWITIGDRAERTDKDGRFAVPRGAESIQIRAIGHARATAAAVHADMEIQLPPLQVRGLYLSFWGLGSSVIRPEVLETIRKARLNAAVIDIKGDLGFISHRTNSAAAMQAGANRIVTLPNAASFVSDLRAKGVYTIARIVTFKDNPLAHARPDLAVKTANGSLFVDREGLAWTDPFNQEVWNYNIAIAIEAAKEGFDEIQFDYVRFPDQKGLQFLEPSTESNRRKAITGFLAAARERLTEYNVFLSADNFGYVAWNSNDTGIGQCFSDIGAVVDYISPMLYPSSFQFGIPGVRNPLTDPYRIVLASLSRAKERTKFPSETFRPWLQAFADYNFDRRKFGKVQLGQQISAAQNAGSDGWLLWDPRNRYDRQALVELAPELWWNVNAQSRD